MIGWSLAFIEIDGKYYGTGTSCWISIGLNKNDPKKFRAQYNEILRGIMKHYKAGTLRPLTRKDVDRFPSDSTMILKDGKITYTDRKKRIHGVLNGFKPWPLLYSDQGEPPTMDLDELSDAIMLQKIEEKLIEKNGKRLNDFCRTLRTDRLWIQVGWDMGGRDVTIIFDGNRTEYRKIGSEIKKRFNEESKRLGLLKTYKIEDHDDVEFLAEQI